MAEVLIQKEGRVFVEREPFDGDRGVIGGVHSREVRPEPVETAGVIFNDEHALVSHSGPPAHAR